MSEVSLYGLGRRVGVTRVMYSIMWEQHFRVWGLGFRVTGKGFTMQGLLFRV